MDGSSDDADEAKCMIIKGERRETMLLKDANVALKVMECFGLDYEPSCVYNLKNQRVNFGNLSDEKTYHLRGPIKIADQNVHVHNALWLSDAVYKADPKARLEEMQLKHTIHTIHAISKHSDQRVILAVGRVNDKDTLYVAFRGTTTWEDAVTDVNIKLERQPSFEGGSFHSGFMRRAKETIRRRDIYYVAEHANCKTIILCGHSLGGAVSSIAALDLLNHLPADTDYKVHNITFGAPFFANEAARKYCKKKNFVQHLLHYVSVKDVVPGLLSLGHSSRVIGETFPAGKSYY